MEHLVDLLERSVRSFGEAPALIVREDGGYRTWSYAQLGENARQLAGVLAGRGVGKGDRVILWAPNHPAWVIAFFATMRLGAVAVPLDMRSADDFVERVVTATTPKLGFVARQTPGSAGLERLGIPLLSLDDLDTLLATPAPPAPAVELAGPDLAEIVFTSGTTGIPKGVMLTHRNIVSNVLACTEALPAVPAYCLLSLLPLSHMLEQSSGLLVPLVGGSRIVYPMSRQPNVLFAAMKDQGVTCMVVVPQALHLFMSAIEREVQRQGKAGQWAMLHRVARWLPRWARRLLFAKVLHQFGGRLDFIMCGGAYLDPELWQKWENFGLLVLQGYGASEASPVITGNTLRVHRMGTVGRVMPGQHVMIAEDGEILTRGANITPGYWQNTEASAAIFQDGWLKTGDLGELDADGFLHFRGRKKDLIVLANGMKVYPEDIENLLRHQPGVTDAVVVGLPGDGGEVDVHAVLLLEPGTDAAATVKTVNRQLATHQRIAGHTVWPEADFPRSNTLKVRKFVVLDRVKELQSGAVRSAAS